MSSGPARHKGKWKILRPAALKAWATDLTTPPADGLAVLEFARDIVCVDPDFGEEIAEHTRESMAPGTSVEVISTFNPDKRYVDFITPFADPGSDGDLWI